MPSLFFLHGNEYFASGLGSPICTWYSCRFWKLWKGLGFSDSWSALISIRFVWWGSECPAPGNVLTTFSPVWQQWQHGRLPRRVYRDFKQFLVCAVLHQRDYPISATGWCCGGQWPDVTIWLGRSGKLVHLFHIDRLWRRIIYLVHRYLSFTPEWNTPLYHDGAYLLNPRSFRMLTLPDCTIITSSLQYHRRWQQSIELDSQLIMGFVLFRQCCRFCG